MMSQETDPRRTHPRRSPKDLEMFCYRAAASATPQQRRNIGLSLLDLSAGGARLRTLEPVARGESVTLELRDRSSGEAFRARGEIRWSASAGTAHTAGIQFREHYSTVELREYFATGLRPAVPDIVLRMAEKRKGDRFSVRNVQASLLKAGSLAEQGFRRNLVREVVDLSPGGAQVLVVEPLEPGALIRFSLHMETLPDTLDVQAAVRWSKPDRGTAGDSHRVGLQFLNLSDDRRRMIEFMRKWFSKPRR
jgi:c-di-GMP-binding flagellar brake protein YcgR